MKAAVLRTPRTPLLIEDVTLDEPRRREVLIRTVAAGVCHSDLHYQDGSYPFPLPVVLGHESAGIVERVGDDVRRLQPGDHVVTCLSTFCGHCEHCLSGHMARCEGTETRRVKGEQQRIIHPDGVMNQLHNLSSFAEYMLVHESACVPIRKDMPLDRAALIGCAVTTGFGAAVHTSGLRPGETVAVIGCGAVGLSTINGAAIAGAGTIIGIDRHDAKLALARRFGATDVLDATKVDIVDQVLRMTGGGVHHSFEAIGLKVTAEQAFRMLRRGGTANVIGMIPVGIHVELHGADFLFEKRIQGSRMGSNRFPIDVPRLVEFYLQGRLHLDDLIARRIRLDQVNEAFEELRHGEIARSVIMFDA